RNKFLLLTSLAGFLTLRSLACGPTFPNSLLEYRGETSDGGVLVAPKARFASLLQLIELPSARFKAKPPAGDYFEQSLAGDLADLGRELTDQKVTPSQRASLLRGYRL